MRAQTLLNADKGKYLLSDLSKAIKLGAEMNTKTSELEADEALCAGYDGARAAWDAAPKSRTCNGLVKADITMFGEPLKKRFRYRMEQVSARRSTCLTRPRKHTLYTGLSIARVRSLSPPKVSPNN